MNWTEYFEMMKDWKRLPAYRAEPRIDSLIGYYLPAILSDYKKDPVQGIIPELPIRLGTIRPEHEGTDYASRSYKVDFYLLGSSGTHYFVEFKTDSGSRRDNQDQYLLQAQALGMPAVIEGIMRIEHVSTYKKKYSHLVSKLSTLGLINESKEYCGPNTGIEIIYVQPSSRDNDQIIDFRWIAQWLADKYGENDFESALAAALRHWADD